MLDSEIAAGPGSGRSRWMIVALFATAFATVVVAGAFRGAAHAALSCTKHWKSSVTTGSIATAANYVEGAAPTGADVVCLQNDADTPTIIVAANRTVGGMLMGSGTLVVNAGVSLSISPAVAGDLSTINNLQLDGKLGGAGPATLTGSTGAFRDGSSIVGGVKTIAAGATYGIPGNVYVGVAGGTAASRGQLVNNGTLNWSGVGHMFVGGGADGTTNGSRLTNAGTFNVTAAGGNGIYDNRGGGATTPAPVFVNAAGGTVYVSGSPGGLAYLSLPFNNAGTIAVSGGAAGFGNAVSLDVVVGNSAGGVDSGTFTAGSHDVITFYGHDRKFSGTAVVTGAGGVTWQGGTLTTTGTPTFSVLTLVAGAVTGSQSITTLDWSGGTFDGSGTTTVPVGGTAALHGTVTIDHGHLFRNLGTTTRPNDGWTFVNNGARILNAGTFAITGDGGHEVYDASHAGGSFRNAAGGTTTFTAETVTGNFHFRLLVDNLGTLKVARGTLFDDGGSSTGVSDTGVLDIATSATYQVGLSRRFGSGALITGDGTLLVSGAARFSGNAVPRLVLTGGTVTGSESVTTLYWHTGLFDGTGTTTVSPGGSVSMQGDVTIDNGRVFRNFGTMYRPNNGWTYVNNGARLENSGKLLITGDGGYALYDSSNNGGSFKNTIGATTEFVAAKGTGNYFLSLPVTNQGTIVATKGALSDERDTGFSGGVLTGGTYVVGNGGLSASLRLPGAVTTNASTLVVGSAGSFVDPAVGTGNSAVKTITANHRSLTLNRSLTLTGALANDGVVVLGYSPSTLRVTSYTQTGSGSLALGIGTTLFAAGVGRPVTINGGSVTGMGTLNGRVSNAGTVTPGVDATYGAPLTVNGAGAGTYSQVGSGTLAVTVEGTTTPGVDFSQLSTTGNVALAGVLAISTGGGYAPAVGDTVTIL
ncbi:MAG: hypothetical protein QOJ03_453, partial [Frankiaceae bacterium]|nr:hypothetical protein [Frankiaceae bacterium]